MSARWLVGLLVSLVVLAFIVTGAVFVYNLGAAAGGEASGFPPILTGLGAVLLLFLVLRLVVPFVFFPLFGFGFWRRRGMMGRWGKHGWKGGHHGWRGWDREGEEGVPPMVEEWHRRMHSMEDEGRGQTPTAGV